MVSSCRLRAAAAAASLSTVLAATGGSFEDGGSTLVSAMMMFLGNENSVYILDKAENNAAQVNGHPAWGSLWDIKSRKAAVMDVRSNVFCASGFHLPNGSYAAFGGNDGVGRDGKAGSQKNPDGTGAWDSFYQDFDGRKAIRIVNPCTIEDNLNGGRCMWFDYTESLAMKKERWYSAAEATGDGDIVIIGGFTRGGFINRDTPVVDPVTQRGQSEPTYEYYPARAADPPIFDFLVQQSGLNAYAHTFLMPSGRMLVQANLSTILWDHVQNRETPLPRMPNGVVRVYPASGAVAMLPLTPENNWTPTLLFCGGSTIGDAGWGNYGGPAINTWEITASKDCQRLTPEPTDGSAAAYEQDDDLLEARTMGQFIALPDGKMLVINGANKGAAGYSLNVLGVSVEQMPFGPSLATDPVVTPAIYDPSKPKGQRWSNEGLSASKVPRLYHSTAITLPDGSVFVAGSNPNPDVDIRANTIYKTEYRSDIFFPPYFSASKRPEPQGLPSTLSYGGSHFEVEIPSACYDGPSNAAAEATKVTLLRSGFTTHAMNMGQRFMQLNSTFTVHKNGNITLHVSNLPPNANLFQPGPALLYVVMNGIPSVGKYVIVGSGKVEKQPTSETEVLPESVREDSALGGGLSNGDDDATPGAGSGSDNANGGDQKESGMSSGAIAGATIGAFALLGLIGAVAVVFLRRRKRAAQRAAVLGMNTERGPQDKGHSSSYLMGARQKGVLAGGYSRASDGTALAPLHPYGGDDPWDASLSHIEGGPYKDSGSYKDSTYGYKDGGDSSTLGRYSVVSRDEPFDPYALHPVPGTGPAMTAKAAATETGAATGTPNTGAPATLEPLRPQHQHSTSASSPLASPPQNADR